VTTWRGHRLTFFVVSSAATRVLPPISLILATWARDYVDGLTATRYQGPATGEAARSGLNRWIGTFAGACMRAAQDASSFEDQIEQIETRWRAQLGQVRSESATDLLLRTLPGAPVVSVSNAAELIGRSFPQANEAIGRLVSAGVLTQINVGKRNRAFEARDIINAFTDLERQLASPEGDARSSEPTRPVPPRRLSLPGDDSRLVPGPPCPISSVPSKSRKRYRNCAFGCGK
jgi:predicted transcriptional regulator